MLFVLKFGGSKFWDISMLLARLRQHVSFTCMGCWAFSNAIGDEFSPRACQELQFLSCNVKIKYSECVAVMIVLCAINSLGLCFFSLFFLDLVGDFPTVLSEVVGTFVWLLVVLWNKLLLFFCTIVCVGFSFHLSNFIYSFLFSHEWDLIGF